MSIKTTSIPNVKYMLLFVILLTALVGRFRYLLHIEHNVDHAYPVWQAMMSLEEGLFPLAGQGTSVLFANPALTGYLFMPVVALTRSPIGVYIFVIALNWLAVWMTYRAALSLNRHRPGGEWMALVAAALMAANPWVIEYSRTSWVQSLLPFFVCGVAWLLWPVLMKQSPRPARRLLLTLVMAALLIQTYLLAYFMLATLALLLLRFYPRLPKRALITGMGVIIGVTVLYGIGLWGQAETVSQRFSDFSSGESRLSAEAWASALRLVTGGDYALARGSAAPAADAALRHTLSQAAHMALLGALLLGLGVALYKLRRAGPARDAALITLLWFWLPIAAMSYTGNPVHTFYQLLGLPAGYVLAAWGLGLLFRLEHSRWGRVALGLLLVPVAALLLTNSARYYQETAAHPGDHALSALSVKYGLQMGQLINQSLPDGGVVYAEAEAWILNSFAGALFPVHWDTRAPGLSLLPPAGGLYVTLAQASPEFAFPVQGHILPLPDDTTLSIITLPPADALPPVGTPLDLPTQQGLRLLSYDLTYAADDDDDNDDAGQGEWHLLTTWRVDDITPEALQRVYAPFVHVFDAAGDLALIVDGEGLAGYWWGRGDVHVHQMRFQLPPQRPAPFRLKLGQFDGLNNANLVFLPVDALPDVVVDLPETLMYRGEG